MLLLRLLTMACISLKLVKRFERFVLDKIITECSVCKKIKEEGTSEDLWVKRRVLARVLNDPNVQISHGYCPECRDKLKETIRSKKKDSPQTQETKEIRPPISLSPEVEGLLNALIKKGLLNREEALEEIRKLLPLNN